MKRTRSLFVILFISIFLICMYVSIRGEYLEIVSIGEEYVDIFKQNLKQRTEIFICISFIIYVITYFTTKVIHRGLKKFFAEEKIEIPKLLNKSISLVFAIVFGYIIANAISEKAILAFNSAAFGIADPVFNLDIGYHMFQKPFIQSAILWTAIYMGIMLVYIVSYNIFTINKYFEKGVTFDSLKKSTFLKQVIFNIVFIVLLIAILNYVNVHDIITDTFMKTSNGTELYGAGLTAVTIKKWGYRIFSVIIVLCTICAIKEFKKEKIRKMFAWFAMIPAYLVGMFLITVIFNATYVQKNQLDKEKQYIDYNIEYTKNAYNINIEEVEIENGGTITMADIEANIDVIENINLLNEEVVLSNLKEHQTSSGYYTFDNTKPGLYKVDGKDTLLYITPREIISNESRTYNNKTYIYTHGYGVIANFANKTDDLGYLNYVKKGFSDSTDNNLVITSPRIYFGMQTNSTIVTNRDKNEEFDYPTGTTTNEYTTYQGKSGLNLNIMDRVVVAINDKNPQLVFSSKVSSSSTIVTTRNIRERAQKVMPYFTYDENPYMVVTDEGRLVWVLDAYTTSDCYPYSQTTWIQTAEGTKKINYIRNSVKVLIDAYDGTMEFYITDRSDPIAMAYWKMYPSLFKSLDESLPEDISEHIVYSEYLYNIQANVLETYHDVQTEVLYRADDSWDIAKENTTTVTTLTGTDIKPYYTMVKTVDEDAKLGLVIPYTIEGKQNIKSYLVGSYSKETGNSLKIYKFIGDTAILGTMQLDTLIEQDEKISKELSSIEVQGTSIEKNIIVVPINNTLLYIEPIYQVMLNEDQVPILKKVIAASGNKIAIGNTLREALDNLLSQEAVSIEIESENIDDLIEQIINANKNLEQSNQTNNWELIGKDIQKLQSLIKQLEKLTAEQENKKTE